MASDKNAEQNLGDIHVGLDGIEVNQMSTKSAKTWQRDQFSIAVRSEVDYINPKFPGKKDRNERKETDLQSNKFHSLINV